MVFEVFRKNQKQMLVALTCLAMFAFVLGGMIDKLFTRAGRVSNPEVASMWGKSVTAEQLSNFREGRRLVNDFMRIANQELSLPPRQPLGMNDESILDGMLMLGKADRMGIVVDDGDVTQYLNQQFQKKLDSKKFTEITSGKATIEPAEGSSRRGRDTFSIGEQQLYTLLAKEIKIQRAMAAIFPVAVLSTPYRSWEGQEPATTKVQLEIVRMPLEKFLDANAKPDEAALKTIYDKYKSQRANPLEDQPGFLIPRKIDAQYAEADVDKFSGKMTASDDEVKAYYEANKKDFRVEDSVVPLPSIRNLPPPPGLDSKINPIKKAGDLPGAPSANVPSPPKADPPKPEAAKSKPAVPAEKKSPEAKKTSFLPNASNWIGSIAMTGTWVQTPKESAKSDTAKAKETKPADAKPAEIKQPVVAPAPPVEPLKPAERFKSLADVKGEIVKRIQRDKARKIIQEKMEKFLRESMYPYADVFERDYRAFRAKSPESAKTGDMTGFKAPPAPDLAKFAADNGIEIKTTGLIDFEAASKLPRLGTAIRVGTSQTDDERFSQFVFRQDLYRGRIVRDDTDLHYFLYWKTKDEPEKTAKFEDVRDQVVKLWREEQAIPKAKAAAEKLVADAQKAGGDLAKAIGKDSGLSVYTTGEFAKANRRMSQLDMFSGGQLIANEVPGVPNAGMDFLNDIFKMKTGEIKVLADQAKRMQYVVKVKSRVEPNFAQFVDSYNFQQMIDSSPRFAEAQRDYGEAIQIIGSGLVRESGFKNRIPELTGRSGGQPQVPDDSE